jgi:hypothetical protein
MSNGEDSRGGSGSGREEETGGLGAQEDSNLAVLHNLNYVKERIEQVRMEKAMNMRKLMDMNAVNTVNTEKEKEKEKEKESFSNILNIQAP